MTKKSALGRGLGALLENAGTDITSNLESDQKIAGAISNIPVNQIEANPFQPRTDFERQALVDLAKSIREHGIIQPVTVRKLGYDRYQLISGERRFRASQAAGLTSIPAYIRIANDQAMLEMAIIENIQRENLNAIEVGLGYKRLIDECHLTQEQLSERIGKDRTTVTNYLRLLKLPDEVQAGIRDRKISMGHARAILGIGNENGQLDIFRQTVNEHLSVRQVEELARQFMDGKYVVKKVKKTARIKSASAQDQHILSELRSRFSRRAGLIRSPKGKGKIILPFNNDEEYRRITDLLGIR